MAAVSVARARPSDRRDSSGPICWPKRMFTGLIEAIGEVAEVKPTPSGFRHAFDDGDCARDLQPATASP